MGLCYVDHLGIFQLVTLPLSKLEPGANFLGSSLWEPGGIPRGQTHQSMGASSRLWPLVVSFSLSLVHTQLLAIHENYHVGDPICCGLEDSPSGEQILAVTLWPLQISGDWFALRPQFSDGSKKFLIVGLSSPFVWEWEWQLFMCQSWNLRSPPSQFSAHMCYSALLSFVQ